MNVRTIVSIILGQLCIDAVDKLNEAEKIAKEGLENIEKECRPLAEKIFNKELLKAVDSFKCFTDVDMWMSIFTIEDISCLYTKILKDEKIIIEEVNKMIEGR